MELLACLILDKIKLHDRFSSWPLHVTLVPWFFLSAQNLHRFLVSMENTAKNYSPVVVTANRVSFFGAKSTIKVMELKPRPALIQLHNELLNVTCSNGGALLDTNHIGPNFKPHISFKQGRALAINRSRICDTLYLIIKCDNTQRQVVEQIDFAKV